MLSMKGREPYIKMQLWLDDPLGVEKLRLWEHSHLETRKRPSTSTNPSPSESPPPPSMPPSLQAASALIAQGLSPEKRPKMAFDPKLAFDSNQFDLFKLWYSTQANNPFLTDSEESKSILEQESKRKSNTPVQCVKEDDSEPGETEELKE